MARDVEHFFMCFWPFELFPLKRLFSSSFLHWVIDLEGSLVFGAPWVACFLSYVEYRPNTNTSNIMKNRAH
jgi:hypothetical protein